MAEPLPVHPLTVDDYHAMLDAGIITEDDRLELIDGQIIEKMTIGPEHIRVVNFLTEVSDKTLNLDKKVKLPRYAAASIPEVWIVNISSRCLERYLDPSPSGYGRSAILRDGDSIEASLVPEMGAIAVADILIGPSG